MSRITAHVLDTALGRPARGLRLRLAKLAGDEWRAVGDAHTNEDGRALDLLGGTALEAGTYRLTFETGPYFEAAQRTTFYPYVEIVFEVRAPNEHYHVPLLLSPFGYSTYRGS